MRVNSRNRCSWYSRDKYQFMHNNNVIMVETRNCFFFLQYCLTFWRSEAVRSTVTYYIGIDYRPPETIVLIDLSVLLSIMCLFIHL